MTLWLRARFHHALARRAEHLAARLAPHVPPRGSVLDVGSGTGHNAEALRRATGGECREVDVVDFHVVGPGPAHFDGARLPLADGAVDVCVLAFVLSYAADPSTLLREAGRVASRGVLVLQSTCPDRASRAVFRVRNWLQGRAAFALCRALGLIPPARLPPQARRLVDRAELAALVAAAGLVLRRVEPEAGFGGISRDLLILDHPAAPIPP